MTRTVKNIIVLTIIYALVIAGCLVVYSYFDWNDTNPSRIDASSIQPSGYWQEQGDRCPEGSYEIGSKDEGPLCKLEPTGCPYGDSIPMDMCDKVKPAEVQPIEVEHEPINFIGK